MKQSLYTLILVQEIEKAGKIKEFTQTIGERIESLRRTMSNPDTDIMLRGLVENTLNLNLELYVDLTGEHYDKRYS